MSDTAAEQDDDVAEAAVLAGYLDELASATADHARDYLDALEAVVGGEAPDTTLPVLLLAVSQVLFTGAQLGALADVETDHRPEAEPVNDADALREGLSRVLDGLDEYADIVDPLTSTEVVRGSVSDDLADVAAALSHGLRHHDEGDLLAALWWWQFSYLADWGERAAASLRVLHSIFAHLRLDRGVRLPGEPAEA